jgi:hypothetical protein
MGSRVPPRKNTDFQSDRAGASSLLQLLDKLYVGGLPSAEPEATMDQMPKPPKKLPVFEEEEAVNVPQNIMGSN